VFEDELQEELNRVRGRRCGDDELAESVSWKDQDAFLNVLSKMERSYLDSYESKWPGEAYQLNQDPDSGRGHFSKPWAFMTLIHNAWFLFTRRVSPPRWASPTEVLIMQKFPVVPMLHDKCDLTTFNHPSEHRKPHDVLCQMGNTMCVDVMSVDFLHSLVSVRRQPVSSLMRNIRLVESSVQSRVKRKRLRSKTPPPASSRQGQGRAR
jgi:hypothetical protein